MRQQALGQIYTFPVGAFGKPPTANTGPGNLPTANTGPGNVAAANLGAGGGVYTPGVAGDGFTGLGGKVHTGGAQVFPNQMGVINLDGTTAADRINQAFNEKLRIQPVDAGGNAIS